MFINYAVPLLVFTLLSFVVYAVCVANGGGDATEDTDEQSDDVEGDDSEDEETNTLAVEKLNLERKLREVDETYRTNAAMHTSRISALEGQLRDESNKNNINNDRIKNLEITMKDEHDRFNDMYDRLIEQREALRKRLEQMESIRPTFVTVDQPKHGAQPTFGGVRDPQTSETVKQGPDTKHEVTIQPSQVPTRSVAPPVESGGNVINRPAPPPAAAVGDVSVVRQPTQVPVRNVASHVDSGRNVINHPAPPAAALANISPATDLVNRGGRRTEPMVGVPTAVATTTRIDESRVQKQDDQGPPPGARPVSPPPPSGKAASMETQPTAVNPVEVGKKTDADLGQRFVRPGEDPREDKSIDVRQLSLVMSANMVDAVKASVGSSSIANKYVVLRIPNSTLPSGSSLERKVKKALVVGDNERGQKKRFARMRIVQNGGGPMSLVFHDFTPEVADDIYYDFVNDKVTGTKGCEWKSHGVVAAYLGTVKLDKITSVDLLLKTEKSNKSGDKSNKSGKKNKKK